MGLQIPEGLPASEELTWARNVLWAELIDKLGESFAARRAVRAIAAAAGMGAVSFLAASEIERVNKGITVVAAGENRVFVSTYELLGEEQEATDDPKRYTFSIAYSEQATSAPGGRMQSGWIVADTLDGFCHSRHQHFTDAFAWCVAQTGLRP